MLLKNAQVTSISSGATDETLDEMQSGQATTQEIPSRHHHEDGLLRHGGRLPRESLCPWRYSNLDRTALSRRLDKRTSRGPFQLS